MHTCNDIFVNAAKHNNKHLQPLMCSNTIVASAVNKYSQKYSSIFCQVKHLHRVSGILPLLIVCDHLQMHVALRHSYISRSGA